MFFLMAGKAINVHHLLCQTQNVVWRHLTLSSTKLHYIAI